MTAFGIPILRSWLGTSRSLLVVPLRLAWRLLRAAYRFLSDPVRAGALSCFLLTLGLALLWASLHYGLGGETRPSPIQLAEQTANHPELFMWWGIAWFAVHALAIPVLVAVFLVHADAQRPALWMFSIFFSLAVLFWAMFGALSIPLGSNIGPHYGEALTLAGLNEDTKKSAAENELARNQRLLWNTPCTGTALPTQVRSALEAVAPQLPMLQLGRAELEAALARGCGAGAGRPLLITLPELYATVGADQARYLADAQTIAENVWVVRKVSDTLYFTANSAFAVALFFYCIFATASIRLRSFSVLVAALAFLFFGLSFMAFIGREYEPLLLTSIFLELTWLICIGTDLWTERAAMRFGFRKVAARPVRVRSESDPMTLQNLEYVGQLPDEWYRNRQVTFAYWRLAREMQEFLFRLAPAEEARSATWFNFAAWASKSVGRQIQRPDRTSPRAGMENELIQFHRERLALDVDHADRSVVVLSQTYGEGNVLAFKDVGYLAVQFLDEFATATEANEGEWTKFESKLGAATEDEWPAPENTRISALYAFHAYYRAAFALDQSQRAALILLGNLCLVREEQRRLQEFVAKATKGNFEFFFAFLYPSSLIRFGWRLLAPAVFAACTVGYALRRKRFRWRGRGAEWERAITSWCASITMSVLRHVVTRPLAKLAANAIYLILGSSTKQVRIPVGKPLQRPKEKPAEVDVEADPDLKEVWKQLAKTVSGQPVEVDDYSVEDDRLDFIAHLFRWWQQAPVVLERPYSSEELDLDWIVQLPPRRVGSRRVGPANNATSALSLSDTVSLRTSDP